MEKELRNGKQAELSERAEGHVKQRATRKQDKLNCNVPPRGLEVEEDPE
jgi:hypothetical protein